MHLYVRAPTYARRWEDSTRQARNARTPATAGILIRRSCEYQPAQSIALQAWNRKEGRPQHVLVTLAGAATLNQRRENERRIRLVSALFAARMPSGGIGPQSPTSLLLFGPVRETTAFAASKRRDVTLAEGCLTCPKSQARNRRAKLRRRHV